MDLFIIGGRVSSAHPELTKLLGQVEERLGLAKFTVRRTTKRNHNLHRSLHGQVIKGRSLEHNGVLVVDVIRAKPTLCTPRLYRRLEVGLRLVLVKDYLNVI